MSDLPPKKLACIGASITFGLGLPDRRQQCYPAVLQTLLGDAWQVRNFGYSGATAGVATNEPYTQTPSMRSALRFEPEVVVLMFGTNDAQFANKPNLPCFDRDYADLIEQFLAIADSLYLLMPPPVFAPHEEIDIATLDEVIRPEIRRLSEAFAVPLIDAYSPFVDREEWFPDRLHPNAEGARLLAETIHGAIAES